MTSNICTILEQRRQLALLRKPANRYEGRLYSNPYELVPSIYNATVANNFIKIAGNEYRIPTANYKMIDLIDNLNLLTRSNGYVWSNSAIDLNNSTGIVLFSSSANTALGLSSGVSVTSLYNGLNPPVFPMIIDSDKNIIKIDNISFSIRADTYEDETTLLAQLNSLTSNYGYTWVINSSNRLAITKNLIYTNLITLTNPNSVSIDFSSTIVGLGFQDGSGNSSEYTGIIAPTVPVIFDSSNNGFTIDGIEFTMSEAIFYSTPNLLYTLNEKTQSYGYSWSVTSANRLKITKSNLISIESGSTLFGINSGSFVSPCVFPIPSPPEGAKAIGYTKDQIDMRRKAEILQYRKSNSQKTGQMTKKGKYANIFNLVGNNNTICPFDLYMPTPTSSSNVPGPITTLQYNESIPLYNYASNADNYANLNPDKNYEFESYSENNVLVANYSTVKIANILINNPNNLTRTFNISVPIGLYVSANSASDTSVYSATYRIERVTFGLYYNGTLIPGSNRTFTTFSDKYVHVTSNTSRTIFSCVAYLGCLNFSVKLDTQKGFVYELRMSSVTNLVVNDMGVSTDMVFGSFGNVSSDLSPINCSYAVVLSNDSPAPAPNPAVNPGKITIT